ncbi:hypothetical protein BX661DRAFT_169513 [Kickxella alabastrina]|uniref:uncharacterized protein n=1 Tax=Kickxella alabastrina TaxID=61397 RepID=UPI00221E99DB|nr:uncharacterized protein BX661DRAFT_169513 [Kickxella alabastrina]KAI7832985.1 hypothetical protein BX661DRAFT_169513 [Kickxella alabastrina]KAJ1940143.1 hypothetical protein GGF37_004098 [Kickxella alabastrina]
MGFCCSKPQVDDDENENTALLREDTHESGSSPVFDRFANMSSGEIARFREEERLKSIEQQTTDSRDYGELLSRFNREIKLPMVTLPGPVEEPRRGGTDVAGVLADAHIMTSDINLLDWAIDGVLDAMMTVRIDPPGECIVALSVESE